MSQTSSTELEKRGVRQRIDAAVLALEQAMQMNDAMQKRHPTGSEAWHQHEAIDDKLFAALAALGN